MIGSPSETEGRKRDASLPKTLLLFLGDGMGAVEAAGGAGTTAVCYYSNVPGEYEDWTTNYQVLLILYI